MDQDTRPHAALNAAIARLLRPLFRILLRRGVPFGAFEELAKRAYVDLALAEFGIPGKKPSVSRVSILSGLTRKDVQRLVSEPPEARDEAVARHNRAARVITGWIRDADFLGADSGFAALVKRHSGDMPPRAMLDELVRVGAVVRLADGRVELRSRAYLPQRSSAEKLRILGSDVADLITTIDHNLEQGDDDPRFQRKVMYDSIPLDAVPAFRKLSAARAQALLEQLDRWLAERDSDDAPEAPPAPRVRIGLGIYYFEEPLASTDPETSK
jgi:hypothetical protein